MSIIDLPLNDLEVACHSLQEAMNGLEGIQVTRANCGHGRLPLRVWFRADSLAALPPLLRWFDPHHHGFLGWRAAILSDYIGSPVWFKIEGPVGRRAGIEANQIASLMRASQEPSE